MTDREAYIALFDRTLVRWEVEEDVDWEIVRKRHPTAHDTIVVSSFDDENYELNIRYRNDGYSGFYARLIFDKDGGLLEFGVWE